MFRFFNKKSGFSLIEIIIVCLLISILLGIGIPMYMNVRHDMDKRKGIFNMYAISQAQKMFRMDQDPQTYSFDIDSLSPDYGEISQNDGTWAYSIDSFGVDDFVILAEHMRPDGTTDSNFITMDQDGVIDDTTGWPY